MTCPSAEERHATAYWVTSRFLLDRFSAHGVPHILRHSSGWRRLFWALVVLGALAALVLQVRATLAEFLQFPKKVTIEVSRLLWRRPAGCEEARSRGEDKWPVRELLRVVHICREMWCVLCSIQRSKKPHPVIHSFDQLHS